MTVEHVTISIVLYVARDISYNNILCFFFHSWYWFLNEYFRPVCAVSSAYASAVYYLYYSECALWLVEKGTVQ